MAVEQGASGAAQSLGVEVAVEFEDGLGGVDVGPVALRAEAGEEVEPGLERGERQQVGEGRAGLQGVDLGLVDVDEREVAGGVPSTPLVQQAAHVAQGGGPEGGEALDVLGLQQPGGEAEARLERGALGPVDDGGVEGEGVRHGQGVVRSAAERAGQCGAPGSGRALSGVPEPPKRPR